MDVNDFSDELFDNPIDLLNAIKNVKKAGSEPPIEVNDTGLDNSEYLTFEEIIHEYGIDRGALELAVDNKEIQPRAYIPVFAKEDICLFLNNKNVKSIVETKFLYEVDHMKVNYSYKAVLLLAIFILADEVGRVNMSDITDFFLSYYNKRHDAGLVVEKKDSTFVKYYGNNEKARNTILRYPIKIYSERGFIRYDRETDAVSINESLVQLLKKPKKDEIVDKCNRILSNYYQLI